MKIIEALTYIEHNFPVYQWKVGNIDVWPLVRVGVIEENFVATSSSNLFNKLPKIIKKIKTILLSFYIILIDRKHNDSVHKADVIFWSDNATRTVEMSSGEKACQNLDMIKIELSRRKYSIYSLENLSGKHIKFPRYTKSDMSIVWNLFRIRFLSNFHINEKSYALPCIDEVNHYLKKNGFSCTSCDESFIKNYANIIESYAKFFVELINKTQAKLVVTVCWHNIVSMSLAYACRKNNIPCVEIQHGLAGGNGDAAYSEWVNVPVPGYNTMPTNFWCWSSNDASSINKWLTVDSEGNKRAFVGGNNTQRYLKQNDNDIFFNKKIDNILRNGKINILITLQTGVVLPEWIVEFINSSSEEFFWHIRTHPIIDDVQQEFIKKIKNTSNVECDVASHFPLNRLLEVCNVHVTSHSAVVLEAEEYGIKSILVCNAGIEYFSEGIDKGYCFFVQDANEFMNIIARESPYLKKGRYNKSTTEIDTGGVLELIKLIRK